MNGEPESRATGSRPNDVRESVRFVVSEDSAGERLDSFLAKQIAQVSRVRIRRGIDDGLAHVDGQQRKASFKISAGAIVGFVLPPPIPSGPVPEAIPLSILHEDDAIAVIDKPPGMVVHPARGHGAGTLASALVHHFGQLSQQGGAARPGIVHRLDRDTSGVIVVAKTDAAHQNLSDQFKSRTVRKEYLAIVGGCPDRDRDLIDEPIGDHPSQRERKALRRGHGSSREAQTFYEVEQRFPGFSLLRALPKTGRTHQIRLHLTHIGHPVLCDKLYGGRSLITLGELRTITRSKRVGSGQSDDEVLLNRQALHAHRLHFAHPVSGTSMEFEASLHADMQALALLLRQVGETD